MTNWVPGHRRVPPGLGITKRLTKNIANFNAWSFMGVIFRIPEEVAQEESGAKNSSYLPEAGDSIQFALRWHGSKGFMIALTSLTEQELDQFEQFVTFGVAKARPIVRERDKVAREAVKNGNYDYHRSQRQDPKLLIKAGEE